MLCFARCMLAVPESIRCSNSTRLGACSRKERVGEDLQFAGVAMTVGVGGVHAALVFGVAAAEKREREP